MTHCSRQILFAELSHHAKRDPPESEWCDGIRTVRAQMPDGQWITGKWTKDFNDAIQNHPAIIVEGDLPLLTEYDFTTVKLTPKSLRDDYDEF